MPLAKIQQSVPSKPSKSAEKNLAKIAKTIQSTHASVLATLESIAKDDPVPKETEKAVEQQQKISSGHSAEFKDLAKSQKRSELHTNPSKLARLIKALNSDVANTNSIEGSVKHKRDKQYGKLMMDLESEITNTLPEKVTADHIGLPRLLRTFTKKNRGEQWANFDLNRKKLISECRELGEKIDAEFKRESELQGFMSGDEFRTLNYKTRAKLVEGGKKDPTKSAAAVRKELRAALDAQRKPSKARWAAFLNLGSGGTYKLTQSGAYKSVPIHLTMSKDSWTSDADGKVDVSTNSVEKIFEKLLKVADWKQLHATLEVPGVDTKNRPHVFLFEGVLSNDRKWAKLDKPAEWKAGAQKEMESQLSSFSSNLKSKIAKAKNDDGAI